MPFINLFLLAGAVMLVMMILLWLLSLALKNSSILDIFWSIGFIVVAWFGFTFASGYLAQKFDLHAYNHLGLAPRAPHRHM